MVFGFSSFQVGAGRAAVFRFGGAAVLGGPGPSPGSGGGVGAGTSGDIAIRKQRVWTSNRYR